jgi:hypothetical protein
VSIRSAWSGKSDSDECDAIRRTPSVWLESPKKTSHRPEHHDVLSILLSIDEDAEIATANREYFRNERRYLVVVGKLARLKKSKISIGGWPTGELQRA